MKARKRLGALVALALAASLMVPATAQGQAAATTYEVQVAQSFFEMGVPGFSARVYPGSMTVHQGDTIHFSDMLALFPEGVYPQDYIPENMFEFEGQYSFVVRDPDDGPRAVKINNVDPSSQCGSQADPCVWDGTGEPIFPAGPSEDDPDPDWSTWVRVDAAPGTVLWGNTIASSEVNTNVKVEVVAPNEVASTQAELDARAAALIRKDYEDAVALHNKMNARRTSHINSAGKRVFDVWVGGLSGPIELFASYPSKFRVPRGARVMFHFQDEVEPHTATFGGARAREVMNNGFQPVCDPDGDDGPAPDTQPDFTNPDLCDPPESFEVDLLNKLVYEWGDGRVNGRLDYENSGVKFPMFPELEDWDSNPYTVRMTKTTNKKGFKYICLIHGGFMGGRVVVK